MAKTRKLRRIGLALAAFAAAVGLWLALAVRDPWPAEQGVLVSPDEEAYTSRIVAALTTVPSRCRDGSTSSP